jgi:site-specific recombinase XerC
MPRQGSRRKLAKYVYQDQNGISGSVYVKGRPRVELRFPLRTPLAEIRRAMELRATQLHAMPATMPSKGTVAWVLTDYMRRLDETKAEDDERGRLRPWVDALGPEPFATLTKGQLNTVADAWRRKGWRKKKKPDAPNTIAKRISALRKVAMAVADASALPLPPHASTLISRPKTPRSGEIRGRDMALVQRVLDQVTDWNQSAGQPSKAKVRLAVWAWTGLNPAMMQLLRPEHVTWTTTPVQLYVQPRRKGAGVDAGWVPIDPHAVEALREFFARGADGPWDKGTLLRAFKRARTKTQRDLRRDERHDDAAKLEGMLPKDLRHSFGTAALKASGDIYGVSKLMRHADIKTTLRYTEGAAGPREHAVIAALTAATSGPEFSTNFSTKHPRLVRRNAKVRHAAPQSAKGGKSQDAHDLAVDPMDVGGRALSPRVS